MSVISEPERTKLYTKVKHLLGAPLRSVEIEDEMLDSLLELSIEDYSQFVQDWLIESQWTSLHNLNVDENSLSRAFLTRDLEYQTRYTYAYSKIAGLQTGGDWVLKKDFIQLQRGVQLYEIPAGREINELLWFTGPELHSKLIDPWSFGGLGGAGIGGAGGFAQLGYTGSYFLTPAFDMLLRLQEINIQRRILSADLTYKITALPDGKKMVHLMNTPGGKFDFNGSTFSNGKVWYWYYDVTGADRDKCLTENPDIIKLPSDVELETLTWKQLNSPSKQWVRKWFVAYVKETLGRVRGKYSGDLKVPNSEIKLDYQSLLTEGKDEKSKLEEELKLRLERLRPDKQLEIQANMAENLNKALKYRPFPYQIHVI